VAGLYEAYDCAGRKRAKLPRLLTISGVEMADIRQVTEQFAVAPQVELDDFADIAALGFTHIINNRPDGEAPDQPSSTEAEAAAKAAGLSYVHAPFVGQPTAEAVKAVMASRGRTLAYCRSGTRSVTAWALAQANNAAPADEIVQAAANAGYNLAPMTGLLRQVGAR
jgi:uncharacterized protein (TIGR01244 family)